VIDLSALRNQSTGLARGGIWFGAGFVVGYGILNGETSIMIAGGLITLVGGGWTGLANTNNAITQAFSQIPSTKKIETSDPVLAEAAKKADPSTVVRVVKEEK
jgi:hypothetical protein